ncbi:MAG: alpha-hydroxy-acid oxidizing protein, partial [Solimonas sp.]
MRNLQLPTGDILNQRALARRRLLNYLVASPLAAGSVAALLDLWPSDALAQSYDVLRAQTKKVGDVIGAPEDALNVMDFEPAAKKALPPAHFGYLATGVDGDATLHAN